MAELNFAGLIQRVRQGDQQAAGEMVRLYEPVIRRAIRFRVGNSMRPVVSLSDICQSVLCSFFVRAASGQFQLDQPEDLQKLLAAMARNKLNNLVRKHQAQRRDQRRVAGSGKGSHAVEAQAAPGNSVCGQVAAAELVKEVHKRLSPEERQLVDWRNEGLQWDQIAGRLNDSPEALRKRLTRALDRVSQELGLEDSSDG
jgi:RNA polymerase sigma factor (sigma-70 family)